MNTPAKSIWNRVVILAATVVTVPLLFGGLIAAGESGDGSVLLLGTLAALAISIGSLSRPLATIRIAQNPSNTQT